MSALAGLLKERGCSVSGSDIACYSPVKELLESLQIPVELSYDLEHLKTFNPDVVVIGNFVRSDNVQAQWARDQRLPVESMPSFLEKYFLQDTINCVVAGTHGKSTTASSLAEILLAADQDPSVFVGAVIPSLDKSFRLGRGKYFVLEGDEYDTAFFDKESKFLHYRPKRVIWTSLEFDHADIFSSIDEIEASFLKLMELLPDDGKLFYCRDWQIIHELIESKLHFRKRFSIFSYGFHEAADFQIRNFQQGVEGMSFDLDACRIRSPLTGKFNAQNLAGASALAIQEGVNCSSIEAALSGFSGVKRRQEVLAEKNSKRVIDDFAHHPTSVSLVIEATKARFPQSKLVVLFEPRSNTTRRNIFQKEFQTAFLGADVVLLPQIFKPEALAEAERLNVAAVVDFLRSRNRQADGPLHTEEILEKCKELVKDTGDITFLVLSNGSFDGLKSQIKAEIQGG